VNLVCRYSLPQIAQRGIDNVLSVEVYSSDANSILIPTAATITIYDGSDKLIDAAAATAGAATSYTWLGAATTSRPLSDDILLVWELTIDGSVYTVSQPGYLVRRKIFPVITDHDLRNYHTELADFRDPDFASFADQRNEAWVNIQKTLIERGRFPHLILDPWTLRTIHIYETFRIIFRDAAQSIGDDRYQTLTEDYTDLSSQEWGRVNFRYDSDEDGYMEDTTISAYPVVYLV
jgi:hypothetical protein